MTERRRVLHPALVAIPVLVYLVSLCLGFLIPSLYRAPRPLAGYVTIVTSTELDRAADILARNGVDDVITPSTTMVTLTRFSGVETVTLETALALDELDPRRDPFITGLGDYFHDGDLNRLFVRSSMSVFRLQRIVRRSLDDGRVIDWLPTRIAAAALLALVGCVASGLACRRSWPMVPFLAIPWVAPILIGSMATGFVAAISITAVAWVSAAWVDMARVSTAGSLRLRETRYETAVSVLRLRLLLGIVMTIVALLYPFLLARSELALPSIVSLVGSLAAAAVYLVFTSLRRRDPEHTLYSPISILRTDTRSIIGERWIRPAIAAMVLLLALPLVADRLIPRGTTARAIPVAGARAGFDYESLAALSIGTVRRELPDVADYLTHVAYQEGLTYGREWGFPQMDETIYLDRFDENADGTYSKHAEPVMTFDQRWFSAQIESAVAGIPRMLTGIGRAAGVVPESEKRLYSGYLQLLHLLVVLLVFSPFLYSAVPRRSVRFGTPTLQDIARRRRRVA